MNQKPKKTAKSEGAKAKQRKASKPKPGPIITPEERMALVMNLPSSPWLLLRIEEEVSDVASDSKAQARERIAQTIEERLTRYDAKAMRSTQGKRIGSLHLSAKFWGERDLVANQLWTGIQYLELLSDQMVKDGMLADSLDRMAIALLIELKYFLLSQHLAGRFPDEQRGLTHTLLLALFDYMRGQGARAASEKGRELTNAERKEQGGSLLKLARTNLPVIVHALIPKEFEAYVDSILDQSEQPYIDGFKVYLKEWRKLHGRQPAMRSNIAVPLVKKAMEYMGIPMSEHRAFKDWISDELGRLAVERQRRRKVSPKKGRKVSAKTRK